MGAELGRSDWKISPFYFRHRGESCESFAVPLAQDESRLVFRLNSPIALDLLLWQEKLRPGSLVRGLAWLAPFPDAPCWHQITDVSMKPVRLGMEITLTLRECPRG
jgi:hypothetical protein